MYYCRSSSKWHAAEPHQTTAKRGLFHRLHDRLKVTTHETYNKPKNATKVFDLLPARLLAGQFAGILFS